MPSSAFKKCDLRSEEHTSELQSHDNLVCVLLLEKQSTQLAFIGRHIAGRTDVARDLGCGSGMVLTLGCGPVPIPGSLRSMRVDVTLVFIGHESPADAHSFPPGRSSD